MNSFNPLTNHFKPTKIDTDKYLKRIRCKRERTPNLKFLNLLHRSHMMCVPFENLDIHMGKEIILDIHKIYQKIIPSNRGGFCYELNGLFYHLLSDLGYQCHLISGRVYGKEGRLGPPFDHAAILVYLEGKVYLADVGFGSGFLTPKLLQPDLVQMDYNQYFKLEKNADDEYTLSCSEDLSSYKPKYIFTDTERQFVEFIDMCQYQQTNKKSPFRQKKMITRPLVDGRVTLTSSNLIITKAGKKSEQVLLNQDEFKVKLLQHFGIRYLKNR